MMVPISTSIKILLLKALVLSVASKALVDGDKDKIVDPDELYHFSLPPSSNSSSHEWDEWDTWEASQDIKNNFRYYRSGYDENGLVIYVGDFGKCNYRELAEQSPEKVEEFRKYYTQFLRRAQVDGEKDNNKGVVIIGDFDGFTLKNFASEKALKMALQLFTGLFQFNHICKYGFLLNVNYAAESFLSLAKPFVGTLMDKFQVYGTLSEKWKPKLIRKIPASQLAPELGGCEDWKPLPSQVTKSQ